MLIAVALLLAGGVEQPASSPAKKEPVICKRDSAATGSNIRSTVCMKKSDWDLVKANSENKLSDMHGRANVAPQKDDRAATPN